MNTSSSSWSRKDGQASCLSSIRRDRLTREGTVGTAEEGPRILTLAARTGSGEEQPSEADLTVELDLAKRGAARLREQPHLKAKGLRFWAMVGTSDGRGLECGRTCVPGLGPGNVLCPLRE